MMIFAHVFLFGRRQSGKLGVGVFGESVIVGECGLPYFADDFVKRGNDFARGSAINEINEIHALAAELLELLAGGFRLPMSASDGLGYCFLIWLSRCLMG